MERVLRNDFDFDEMVNAILESDYTIIDDCTDRPVIKSTIMAIVLKGNNLIGLVTYNPVFSLIRNLYMEDGKVRLSEMPIGGVIVPSTGLSIKEYNDKCCHYSMKIVKIKYLKPEDMSKRLL